MGNSTSSASTATEATKKVDSLISENKVMIFSTTTCPYCKVVKRLFNEMGTKFHAVELNKAEDGEHLIRAVRDITGSTYVPQVFICGKNIGGCQETRELQKSGQLSVLLKLCCNGDVTCGGGRI